MQSKYKSNDPIGFWERVNRSAGPDKCWLWLRATNNAGYGQLKWCKNRRNAFAHRVAWELTYGPIPDGLWVLHRCDNPLCCNPSHLFLGTLQDNIDDMVRKGRSCPGERNGYSKLTNAQVISIRALHSTGQYTYTQLSKQFGVASTLISKIVHRSIWRHI